MLMELIAILANMPSNGDPKGKFRTTLNGCWIA